ncbi:MAG: acyltransferase family protein [Asticcacaulis sp.]
MAEADRLHALDAVRAGALFLGIAVHGALAYTDPHYWVVNDETASPVMAAVFFLIHIFRMSLFFVLAGFFARLLYERRGTAGFISNRLKRVAAPLVIFWLPVMAAIITLMIMAALKAHPELAGQAPPPQPPLSVSTFPLTHLWFLYLLLWFYVAAVVVCVAVGFIDRHQYLKRGVDALIKGILRWHLGPVVLGVPLFFMLMATPVWGYWGGIPTPDIGLIPNNLALVAYGSAFAFGWVLHRLQPCLEYIKQGWPAYLLVAIICSAWCLNEAGLAPLYETAAGRDMPLYALAYVIAIWSWVLGLTGAALKFLSHPNRFWRFASDSSYWVYIVHLPLVLLGQYLLMGLALPALAKFALVVAGTAIVGLISYRYLVRYSFIGRLLNGKRLRSGRVSAGQVSQEAGQ